MMFRRLPALLYFASYILLVLCDPVSNHILEFNDNSIEETIARSEFSFIYFYSDTCKYCAEFEPQFEYLSVLFNNVTDNDGVVQVLKTNAVRNKRLRQLFQVTQYPTLKLLNYQTKEIISYNDHRDLETLSEFITRKTNARPNHNNFESPVEYLHADCERFIQSSPRDTLVVFTAPHAIGWDYYGYPSHFYQELALSEYKEKINFALVDFNEHSDNEFLAKYAVNQFPAMIYFTKEGRFKVYNRELFSELNRDVLALFLENLHESNPFGQWFDNHADFENHINKEGFFSTSEPVRKYGFNSVQGKKTDKDIDMDEEYDILVDSIAL